MKGTFNAIFKTGEFFLKGYVLKKEEGARFSNAKEESLIFNRKNKGILIDGKNKRLSEKDSCT